MPYVITIDTDNAAFDGCPGYELARILRGLADTCTDYANGHVEAPLIDSNGNVVGCSKLEEDKHYGYTNWDTWETMNIIESREQWCDEALVLHVDELRDEFAPIVEDVTADTDSEVDLSVVNWLEIYGALRDF